MPGESGTPSAAEAASTLAELAAIRHRSRRVAHAGFTRASLVLWGVAWLCGYAALDLLPWPAALPVGIALSALAAAGTWLARSDDVVSGWQRGTRRSWWVIMACSPFLVATVTPAPLAVVVLVLGALWGVALLLFAVATGDMALGAVGALVVACAPPARWLVPGHSVLAFGLVAGGAMIVLGVARWARAR